MQKVQPLDDATILKKLTEVSDWTFENNSLVKRLKFKNFKQALTAINHIGAEAEKQNHHPEIFNVYSKVTLTLRTHDAQNMVTQKDFDLAIKIDQILSSSHCV